MRSSTSQTSISFVELENGEEVGGIGGWNMYQRDLQEGKGKKMSAISDAKQEVFRTENDSLGEVRVPSAVLWGAQTQTTRASGSRTNSTSSSYKHATRSSRASTPTCSRCTCG